MKYITFTLDNGDVYGLPLERVARERALYYLSVADDTTMDEEVAFVMNDNYEGIDWFRNNQNPKDFDGHYVLIRRGTERSLLDRIDSAETIGIEEIST